MALLPLVYFPDPRLLKKAEPVTKVDDTIRQLVKDMIETMYHEKGAGLAANQVGNPLHIFVMDLSEKGDQPVCAINAEIISREGEKLDPMGCLSLPGAYGTVPRSAKLRFKALDENGKEYEMDVEEIAAHCVEHELDHLNGKLFIHRMSSLKRERAIKQSEKFRREKE